MAIDRPAISMAIPLAVLLASRCGPLVAQVETSTLRLRRAAELADAYGADPL